MSDKLALPSKQKKSCDNKRNTRSIKTKKNLSEHQEQIILFKWAQTQVNKYPPLNYMFSTLNGVRLKIGQARRAKESGNKRGVPDVILPFPCNGYSGLFIELKVGKNKPTPDQIKYMSYLNDVGYLAKVAYGSKEAIGIIEGYIRG